MNRKLLSSLALVLLVVLFVSINIGSNNALRSLRFDLTEEKTLHPCRRFQAHHREYRRTDHPQTVFFRIRR